MKVKYQKKKKKVKDYILNIVGFDLNSVLHLLPGRHWTETMVEKEKKKISGVVYVKKESGKMFWFLPVYVKKKSGKRFWFLLVYVKKESGKPFFFFYLIFLSYL